MKNEELMQLKNEFETLATKLSELNEEELDQVIGGFIDSVENLELIKDFLYKVEEQTEKCPADTLKLSRPKNFIG